MKLRPVAEIKVGLGDLHEAREAVNRAESSAEVDRSRRLLDHANEKIFFVDVAGVERHDLDTAEVVHVLKTTLGHVGASSRRRADPAQAEARDE